MGTQGNLRWSSFVMVGCFGASHFQNGDYILSIHPLPSLAVHPLPSDGPPSLRGHAPAHASSGQAVPTRKFPPFARPPPTVRPQAIQACGDATLICIWLSQHFLFKNCPTTSGGPHWFLVSFCMELLNVLIHYYVCELNGNPASLELHIKCYGGSNRLNSFLGSVQ